MKVLTLLRHAKSGWDDGALRDFDRPLNPRGRRAARTVGREMRRLGLRFDRVLASPARRVVETLEEVAGAFGPLEPAWDERLYLAPPATLLDIARETEEGLPRLLLVGHNPGLEELVQHLAGGSALRDRAAVKYPTATLAELRFEVASWRQLGAGGGTLARFVRPRDLDSGLGPEE
jgi:phosphohistidine phosphatase